jgi:hypothetical protein
MSLLSIMSFKSTVAVNEPLVASSFSYTKVAHGFPIHYETIYNNNSGVYGTTVPSSTGFHMLALIIDFALWIILFVIILTVPTLLFEKKQQPTPSLRSQQRFRK